MTTSTTECRLSANQFAKVTGPHVWLDDEDQAELGELTTRGLVVIGTPEALRFMADNADDYLTEYQHTMSNHMVPWSWRAVSQRLRRAADGLPSTPSGH